MARCPFAVRLDGPADKQGYEGIAFNACRGVVLHDSTGPWAPTKRELLLGPWSWYATVDVDGTIYEHYDSTAVLWHAGTKRANGIYIGIEHCRKTASDASPIEGKQLEASVRLVRWLAATHRFQLARNATLWEHNQLSQTACPSHRIPWQHYTEEDDMKPYFAWADNRLWFVGPGGAHWVTTAAAADELAKIHGLPTGDATVAMSKEAIAGLGGK